MPEDCIKDKEPIIEELTELGVEDQIKDLEEQLPYVRQEIKDFNDAKLCHNCFLYCNVPDTQLMCSRCGTPFIDKEVREIPNNLLEKEKEIIKSIDGLKSLHNIIDVKKTIKDQIDEFGDEDIYIDPRLVVHEDL